MNLRFFIDRPVFSGVISVVIVLMGVIAMKALPVEQYPDIAPPTVNVFCTYPGANAETVQKAVIVPLEEAINGVEDMIYMTSTASNTGDASINIYFKQGANADMAAVNVQNRVNGALSQLPAEATKSGVTTEKQQNAELMTFALYSPDDRFDQTFLNNYMKINVEPRLKRISGVGKAQLFGSNYSMRLWLRPDKMAQYGLIPNDISAVLARQNIEAATGSLGQNSEVANEYTMKYRGRLSTSEEFGELVVKSLPDGNILRLKEVADIELGDEFYNYSSEMNGHPAAMMMINQKSGSNASSTINEIHGVLDDLGRNLPEGMEFVVLTDTNKFLNASIRSVLRTLIEAILLVIVVVYVFLQDIKSTLIPTISIFVSIIGTFAVMSLIGFSINLLTLFALVLAIGTVVDDAIVVVEAVQTKFDEGYQSPVLASDNLNIVLPWNTVYKVIRQTNNLIQKIESGSIQSSDTKELNRIKSEALVMRGLSLFNLTRLFGMPYTNDKGASLGVPIETSPSDPTHKPSRSTVAQCYEQIVSDMSNALSGLRQETSNGYINYWAAQALLSRVYLNMGEYQKAYDAATDVIKNNGGRYQLYSYEEYPNVWGQDFQSESLFELYITLSEPSGGTGGEGAPMVYANEATVDWNNLILSEDFLNLLNEDPKDVRHCLTKESVIENNTGLPAAAMHEKVYLAKFPGKTGDDPKTNNICIIRLSEVYLNAAEAGLKKGTNLEEAQGYLNDIISRRTTDTSQQVSTETFTLDRILKERRKELVGEGEVFYDYLRNGLAIERKGSWHLETLKASNAQKIEATDLRIALPIPQSEIDANPNIQQNPR